MKWSIHIFSIIILITFYHYYIHNKIEKRFFQRHFDYDAIKRPLLKCAREKTARISCIGMPSGHTEAVAVFTGLLYLYKMIPLWVCIIMIILIGTQRIACHMHTLNQVLVGGLFGILYAFIYKQYAYGFVGIFLLGIMLLTV